MTATATPKLAGAALATVLAVAGCGGGARHPSAARSPSPAGTQTASQAGPASVARLSSRAGSRTASHPGPASAAFAWLRPAPPPTGWHVRRLASGAAGLAAPPGWRTIRTDPGTVSLALLGPHGRIHGYLNATPQSGEETLANWTRFRRAHNREEGDRAVITEAAGTHLRFRTGTGACVEDRYATVSARYREIACLVRGARATTVIVAAALPRDWATLAPALRRSVASFST